MRVVALLLLAVTAALAAYCHGGPSPDAKPNLNPPFTSAPVLINETTNGKLYIAGPPGGEFYVMHLWGSPYVLRSDIALRIVVSQLAPRKSSL
jgi:hypothetical protein